jgi:tetratricopeptide (TPR) repeat protein
MGVEDEASPSERLFHSALSCPPAERAAFLARSCAGQEELRREVESLLAAHEAAGPFLDQPALGLELPVRTDDTRLSAELLGTCVGPFRLLRRIGEGGMGSVYEAEGEAPRRRVALKILRAGFSSGSDLRRFQREAALLARLQHPGIAQLHQAGLHAIGPVQLPWLALELVEDARTITRSCDERALGMRARIQLFLQVAEAVRHGHQKGVLHRDLKPSNLLVGGDGRAKVIDFGVARATGEERTEESFLTEPGRIVGTLQYMSPEQCRGGADALDVRSDVYALGLVLYELLCKSLPYRIQASSVVEAVGQLLEAEPRRPREARPGLDADLEIVLLTALRREPAERYASVGDLIRDLEHWLRSEPIEARRASAWYVARKFVARHRRTSLFAALLLCTLLGSSIGFAWLYRRAERERTRADQRADEIARMNQALQEVIEATWLPTGSAAQDPERAAKDLLAKLEARIQREFSASARAPLLYSLAIAWRTRGEHERARDLLVSARAISAADPTFVATYPALALTMLYELAGTEATLGELDRCGVHVRELLDDHGPFAAMLGFNQRDYALGRLIDVQLAERDFLAARDTSARRLELVRAHDDDPAHRALLQSLLIPHALILRTLGDFAGAQASLGEARERWERDGERTPLQAFARQQSLAALLVRMGRHEEALAIYRELETQALSLELLATNSPAHMRNNQALCLGALGRFDEARALFTRVLAEHIELHGPQSLKVGQTHQDFARVLFESGDLAGAEEHSRSALVLFETAALSHVHEFLGSIWQLRGELLLARGEFEQAEEALGRSLEANLRWLPAENYQLAEAESARAVCGAERGRGSEAERALRESSAALERVLGREHPAAQRARKRLGEFLAQAAAPR